MADDGPSILLVEDNPLDARATFTAAHRLDMADNIQVVTDGRTALDALRGNGPSPTVPSLVLLDLNLAGPDGADILAEIRADPQLGPTPVVVLTGSAEQADVERAYRQGANAFITKPDDLDGWVQVISTINDFWLSVARLPAR